MASLYMIIPAYNEEESLPSVLDQWYEVLVREGVDDPRNRLIVVNDGSTDDTKAVVEGYASTHPQVVPVTKENGGHGAAIYDGYLMALDDHPDFIFQTDSDGQTAPEDFPAFWAERDHYDVVMGDRACREDGFSRVVVTKVLKAVTFIFLRARVRDANVPFRLMSYQALSTAMAYVPERYNLTNVALSAAFCRTGQRIKYLPIRFSKREAGTNSINLKSICGIGIQALRDFRSIGKSLDAIGKSGR